MREDPLAGPLPGAGRPPPGAFPPRRCAATGSGSARKGPGAKVARGLGRELYSDPLAWNSPLPGAVDRVLSAPSLPPHGREGRGPLAPGATVDRGGLSSVRLNRVAPPGRGPAHVWLRKGSAAMSATHPTRLETRTKESNARASQRVEQTPRRNESEGRRAPAEVGSRAPRGLPGAPPARLARRVGEVELERVR